MPQMFKAKYIVNFRKYRSRKKVRFDGVKMAKSNKIEKTEELVAGYQEVECLSSSYKDRNLRQIVKPKLPWKQPLRRVVDLSYTYS